MASKKQAAHMRAVTALIKECCADSPGPDTFPTMGELWSVLNRLGRRCAAAKGATTNPAEAYEDADRI